VQALALAGRCVLALHEGRIEEGWGLLEASRVILTAEGNMYQMVWNDLMALEAVVPLENPDLALALCDRASAVAREAEITSLQVRVEDARSRVLEESGDLAGALAASRASTLLERQRAELHLAAAERAGVHAQESLVAFKKAAWERRRRREAEEGALRLREALETESHLRQLLETTARTDVLTGIPNRRAHEEDLHAVLADAARSSRCVTLLMIDVDRFKSVNDRFGHDVGDEVLVEMAARFRGGLRAADRVSRWGGEEFIVTAPGTDRSGAEHLAEQLRGVIGGRPFATSIGPLEVTVSIGAVVCHPEGTDREEILRRADAALYRAKRGGRNRIVVADREAVQ
jgi:diguanylate cyclase (GGDEF)-like protein